MTKIVARYRAAAHLSAMQLEFILCPVHHNYYVRRSLAELGLRLINENLIEEKRRFYELMHLSLPHQGANQDVGQAGISQARVLQPNMVQGAHGKTSVLTATGSKMWQGLQLDDRQQAERYLLQTISHYQKIPSGRLPHKPQIVAAYQQILQQLCE